MVDVSKYIDRAEAEAKRRNYDQAIKLFREILKIDADCGEARRGIRHAAIKKHEKRYPSAIERGVLTLPSRFFLVFAGLFRAHSWIADLCESALRHDPKNVKLNLRLGHALLAQGHQRSAEAAFAVVTEFDQKDAESLKILGKLYADRKELDRALECYERALKVNPRDQEAGKMRKNLAAEGAIQRGGFEKAQSARELARDQGTLKKAERGRKIVRTAAEVAEALEETEAALEEAPDDLKLRIRLGELHLQKEQYDDAVDAFLIAQKASPDDREVADKLGDARIRRAEHRLRQTEAEAQAGEEGAEDRIPRLKNELADLRLDEYRRRVAAHPTDTALRFRLGTFLLDAEELEEAIEHLQQAVKDPKHRVQALHQLGRAFARKGIVDLAAKQLSEAAEKIGAMTDQRKEILYELAQLHERAGASEDALTVYKEIYEADIAYRDVGRRIEALSASN